MSSLSSSFSPPNLGSNALATGDSLSGYKNYDGTGNSFRFPAVQPNTSFIAGNSTGMQPSILSSSWQTGTPPSLNAAHVQLPSPNLSLGQLLDMYPIVQELHNRVSLAVETQAALIKENIRLSNELREITANRGYGFPVPSLFSATHTRTPSLAPSDSLSAVLPPPAAVAIHQPATRPAKYPVKILWSLEDSKKDADVGSSDRNLSRPAMGRVLRHADGTDIDDREYYVIKATAHAIAYKLRQLPSPAGRLQPKDQHRTMRFYKNHMVREWNQAIADAENQQELLALCSAHWKAEHVIKAALQAANSSATKSKQGKSGKRSHSPPNEISGSGDKRVRSDSITSRAKHRLRTQMPEAASTGDLAAGRLNAESRVPQPPVTNTGKSNLGTTKFQWGPAKTAPDVALETLLPALVFPSYENIIYIIASEHPDLRHLNDAIELLHTLKANPTFTTATPSSAFSKFLAHIETAIPSPVDDEDHTNQSWGHQQFTAGKLTCTTVLKTWASVGSPLFAYKLITAALTTCCVARWLCSTRPTSTPVMYLSDNYLDETCRLLWGCWKSAGGPTVKGKAKQIDSHSLVSSAAPAAPPTFPLSTRTSSSQLSAEVPLADPVSQPQDALDATPPESFAKLIGTWTVIRLRKWISDHGLSVPPNSKKDVLVNTICGATGIQRPSVDEARSVNIKRGRGAITESNP